MLLASTVSGEDIEFGGSGGTAETGLEMSIGSASSLTLASGITAPDGALLRRGGGTDNAGIVAGVMWMLLGMGPDAG